MLVGEANSGKSTILNILKQAFNNIRENFPDSEDFFKI